MNEKDIEVLNIRLNSLIYLTEDKQVTELASIVQQILNGKVEKQMGFGVNDERAKS